MLKVSKDKTKTCLYSDDKFFDKIILLLTTIPTANWTTQVSQKIGY